VALGYYTWVTEGLKVRILQPWEQFEMSREET
jgi:hypothetical protein